MAATDTTSRAQRLPILFIMITMVIDAMGIGLIMPVMPELIQEVSAGALGQAAIWGGILASSFAVMQFLFAPMLGRLSDAYGRRPILLVSLIVMAADYVVMGLAGSVWILLLARIIGGITAATHSTALAYMADISDGSEKAKRFGLIGAAFGLGFVLGPGLGGLLAEFGTRAPFYMAAALAFANAIFGWVVLPETVTEKTRRAFRLRGGNPLSAFVSLSQMPMIRPLTMVYFLYQLATMVYPAVWAYFATERFGWSPGMIGVSLMLYGIGAAVVQGVLVGPVIARLGQRGAVMFGLTIEVVIFGVLGFISSGTITLILTPLMALGNVGLPALQGIIAQKTPDDSQGEMQGVLSSISSIAMIMGPLVLTQIFAWATRDDGPIYLPGAPFLLSGILMTVAVLLFVNQAPKRSAAV
ncbi:TCR/Tet family MFS transporter [Thalassovita mediterranea]|jgi:DHA1 family tetracycline resistance protein-like MFS transporter|uniref:Tetracycline resistance protein, class C n=1 Tax=Thalassovita mediterranea TaxID=340021 RepID=A0A0P1H1Z3_9RHOB|nr:TCR/Tet family MFS transporter [Thalassovita mediterranea]CUH84274.1 Tetracycline resistance protein, class C [Thalassovita mediterranea]SIS27505.1 MFS transporter, DHA1 family, tetracycline resistance protein [Thalassovita mediterranea]